MRFDRELIRFCKEFIRFCTEIIRFDRGSIRFYREFIMFYKKFINSHRQRKKGGTDHGEHQRNRTDRLHSTTLRRKLISRENRSGRLATRRRRGGH